jgi:hypothetical protein
MQLQQEGEQLRALLQAHDSDDNRYYGWMLGTLDLQTNTITWTEDEDANNPICSIDDIDQKIFELTGYKDALMLKGIHQLPDGSYTWVVIAHRGGQDNLVTLSIPGASSMYDISSLKDEVYNLGFRAKMVEAHPNGSDGGLVGQEEYEVHSVCHQKFHPDTPLIMAARAQVWPWLPGNANRDDARRPYNVMLSPDGKSYRGLAFERSTVLPFEAENVTAHYPSVVPYASDTYGFFYSRSTIAGDGWDFCTTDSRGFQRSSHIELFSNESGWPWPMGAPVITEDYTVAMAVVHGGDDRWLLASCARGREAHLEIADGETEGQFVTSVLQKPEAGWESLFVSLDLQDGDIKIQVLEPLSVDTVIDGYELADMDALSTGNHQEVTWGGNSLSELDSYDYIRLHVSFSRSAAEDNTPQLFEWYCTDGQRKHKVASQGGVAGTPMRTGGQI